LSRALPKDARSESLDATRPSGQEVRSKGQFQALRYFTLDGTDHRLAEEQNSIIRRYIIWRNRNAHDKTLRELVKRANVA
jgi:hypothetical protein